MANRLKWTLAAALTGVAGLGLIGGCDMNRRARTVPLSGVEETASLSSAPLAVDIENRSGTVVVRVDPTAKQPAVMARPADGRAIRKDDKPWAAAELAAQDEHRVLRVVAGGGDTQELMTPIIVTVVVPSCDGVRVKNAGGPVTLEGVGGAISVSNTDLGGKTARIAVETRRDLTLPVSLVSTGGDVSCLAGHGTAGKVTLTATNGHPEIRVRSATRFGASQSTAEGWTGTFGSSDNPITLTTDHGNAILELR
ncbi:MAG: hypothetical protein IT436_00345 [Phycisphaerales bacterium]|nr:hypothetical protein [Phycisphaerales bacterium]